MSILRRIGSAFALIWQIVRLSLPENLNKTNIGAFVLVGVLVATVVIFYLTSPRLLKISEYAAGGTAVPEASKAPVAKEPRPVTPVGPVIDPLRLGSRFPYPTSEKSPFEVVRAGPAKPPFEAADQVLVSAPPSTDPPKGEHLTEVQQTEIARNLYPPAILIGRKEDRRLIFFWAPDIYESVIYFRRQIAPIISGTNRNYSVLIVQLAAAADDRAISPGGSLLCVDSGAKYQSIVLNLLRNAEQNTKVSELGSFRNYMVRTNSNIVSAFKKASLSGDLQNCLNDRYYRYRLAQWYKQNELFSKKFSIKRVPFVVLDGEILNQPDKQTLLSILRQR